MAFGRFYKSAFSFGQTQVERRASKLMLLIGTFMFTQIRIGGYAAISEFILVAMAPFMLLNYLPILRRDQCSTFHTLVIIWILGAILSDLIHGIPLPMSMRGLTPAVSLFTGVLFMYVQLRRNPDSLKWYLLGSFISSIIAIFVFQTGADVGTADVLSGQKSKVEAVVGYKLFWVMRISLLASLPVMGWYRETPHLLSVMIAFLLALFGLYSGGRSTFANGMVKTFLIFMGGKTREKMLWIRHHWIFLVISLLVLAVAVKGVYKLAATSGWMGEKELEKYEKQAKGKSFLQTLMSGRMETFVALSAVKDSPWLGHGSCALDYNGYVKEFVLKYGAEEDIKMLLMGRETGNISPIPAHSHIVLFWMWAGIAGLIPWLYVLWLLVRTLFQRMHVMPMYYGYFALTIPGMLWGIFFSPFGLRLNMSALVATCLLVQTVSRQRRAVIR